MSAVAVGNCIPSFKNVCSRGWETVCLVLKMSAVGVGNCIHIVKKTAVGMGNVNPVLKKTAVEMGKGIVNPVKNTAVWKGNCISC